MNKAAMLRAMATMQDEHNEQVHPDWRNSGAEYYRAVWVECAEMLEHFGWKWWKRQQPDLWQVKLELVDIWHFGMSDLLRSGALREEIVELLAIDAEPAPARMARQLSPQERQDSQREPGQAYRMRGRARREVGEPSGPARHAEAVRLAIEDLACATLAAKAFALPQFARVMAVLPLSYEELFRLYVGKNVLNRFRQDHGYKAGAYVKIWAGREDNEHLVELLGSLENPATAVADLYRQLKARYPG